MGDAATTIVTDAPTWVLLHVEAQARGFKNSLAFRRWLRRHAVPVRRDGHRVWVRRADVDRAVEGIPPASNDVGGANRAAVVDAVECVTRRR